MVIRDLASRQTLSANTLRDRLEPRMVSADGRRVASVTPGGAGYYGLHKPGGRERTTVVVSERDGAHARLDLEGNIEPEAFSRDGDVLYVLDYLPAAKPERFRVRARGSLCRSERRRRRGPIGSRAFTTRGGRCSSRCTPTNQTPSPSCKCLHLGERWVHRLDLPSPFGRERPGVHGIALSASGDRLCVVHAATATVADIDPDRLLVKHVTRLAPAGLPGKPNARITDSGRLVVNVDNVLVATDPRQEIATPGEARGLALGGNGDVRAGHPSGVVRYDLASGAELGRIAIPDLFVVKHVRAT